MSQAADVIARLGLRPHPEGGHYGETYRHHDDGGRGACTAIHYLLQAGERSHWHRVDAVEIWLWHGGEALRLSIAEAGQPSRDIILGGDVMVGDSVQAVVPAHAWQAAEPLGAWTLVSCIVAPAFHFDGFEMAPPGWAP
ncbi:cupin domain-containing protein [Magnetospirillum sulfuroxidans]|uniref:Cupin domain-containing protein n=1 Tax=Magnetospirillum sulfuroxidans TaxID=611300 RepID=A0ABS5IBF8_9PROT|nr:cupin domain-containing protein [Magnetospirillum sulfuroxidans]MBR9971766.1 cupin domain-containing protein [Magnetospirillum sulfuroxidans]